MRKLFSLFLLVLFSCGSSSTPDYRIALDPEWYALGIPGREAAIRAFSVELVAEIAKKKKVKIALYDRSWDSLMLGLNNRDYDAVLTNLRPYLFYEKLYDFSAIYLETGPTFVIPTKMRGKTPSDFDGKEIAVLGSAEVLEKYPGIIVRTYDSVAKALSDTYDGTIDGTVTDLLTAEAYCRDLYQDKLKVAFPPFIQEGLRLIAIKDDSDKLIKIFNDGLKDLQRSGRYDELLRKWNLAH
ncbi:MAG: amino acid ABC transporter substrate-binding protein [Verrucomicrobia bacterium]|nr:amino acid ABC transporter substrate-binding protein [Verrucomicrobiota bacterium]